MVPQSRRPEDLPRRSSTWAGCMPMARAFEKDPKEAVKWYRKAADQGHAGAQHNLGWMYANGEGGERDPKEAVKWYRKAADQGMRRRRPNWA